MNPTCTMCGAECSERNLTRIEDQEVCPACCKILGRDSIADWPDSMMYCRFDCYPWRPQDYR